MADERIEFTGAEKDMIKAEAVQAMHESLKENVNFSTLREKAQHFLDIYNKSHIENLQKNYEFFNKQLKTINSFNGNKNSVAFATYVQSIMTKRNTVREMILTALKEIYIALFDFDNEQAIYREQLPKLMSYVYTTQTLGKPTVYTFEPKEVLKFLQVDESGQAKIIIPTKKALESINKVTKYEHSKAQKEQEKSVQAFTGTYSRLERFYDVRREIHYKKNNNDKTKKHQRSGGLLLWKEPSNSNKWKMAFISNYGSVKEAYVSAIINNSKDLSVEDKNEAPYYAHSLIRDFFKNYILKVTNKPAIMEEDIVGNDAQYAIKSGMFGLPNIQQFVIAASNIIYGFDGMNEKQILEGIKADSDAPLNKMIKSMEDIANEETREALKSIRKNKNWYF